MRGAFSMYLISMIYRHCLTVCLFHVPINDGRLCSPLFTKNINIKSNCNCILIKNKVHFAIDIFFFQSALTFLEFNALRIFFKSALLFASTEIYDSDKSRNKKKGFFTHIYSIKQNISSDWKDFAVFK